MASWSAILVVAAKDAAQRNPDRSALVMGPVGPLALALIRGGTLGGATTRSRSSSGAVEDDGSVAQGILEAALEDDRIVGVADPTPVGPLLVEAGDQELDVAGHARHRHR